MVQEPASRGIADSVLMELPEFVPRLVAAVWLASVPEE